MIIVYLILLCYAIGFSGHIVGIIARLIGLLLRMVKYIKNKVKRSVNESNKSKPIYSSNTGTTVTPIQYSLSYEQTEKQAKEIIVDSLSYNQEVFDELTLEGKATYNILDALSITAEDYTAEYSTEYWEPAFIEALSDVFDGAKCKSLDIGRFELASC